MGAITGTKVTNTEFGGKKKIQTFTATVASASDTVDLSSYFTSIDDAFAFPTAGIDADFQTCSTSVSTTTVTVTSYNGAGTAATEFTGTTIKLLVIGEYN